MRYPASEKLEIIRIVEQSHLPIKVTLDKLGIPRPRSTAGMIVSAPMASKGLRTGIQRHHGFGTAFPTMSAAGSSTWRWSRPNCRRASWRCASPVRFKYFVSEASVYRLLKAHDPITSPAFIVIKAGDEFEDKTTRPNRLWQTDLLI